MARTEKRIVPAFFMFCYVTVSYLFLTPQTLAASDISLELSIKAVECVTGTRHTGWGLQYQVEPNYCIEPETQQPVPSTEVFDAPRQILSDNETKYSVNQPPAKNRSAETTVSQRNSANTSISSPEILGAAALFFGLVAIGIDAAIYRFRYVLAAYSFWIRSIKRGLLLLSRTFFGK